MLFWIYFFNFRMFLAPSFVYVRNICCATLFSAASVARHHVHPSDHCSIISCNRIISIFSRDCAFICSCFRCRFYARLRFISIWNNCCFIGLLYFSYDRFIAFISFCFALNWPAGFIRPLFSHIRYNTSSRRRICADAAH
jgi:hypothetical protein